MTSVRVIAIVAMFNEADIIEACIRALNQQGVDAYILDDGSTDQSVHLVEPFLGRGVVGIERLPSDGTFNLTRILQRKEALARELGADWFINHDADEFRESPWPGVALTEALSRVDTAGFNAVDFALLDFWPRSGSSGSNAGDGAACSVGAAYNSRQVRCWKKGASRVDLVSSAGHDVAFPGRRVFPLRFLLKHYPLRDAEHAARKIWHERVPRFDRQERARGWHVQYDSLSGTSIPEPDSDKLIVFDPARVRMEIAVGDLQQLAFSTDADDRSRHEQLAVTHEAHAASRREVERLQQLRNVDAATRAALEEERLVLLEQQRQMRERLTDTAAARDAAQAHARDLMAAVEQQRHDLSAIADSLRDLLGAKDRDLDALQRQLQDVRLSLAATERQLTASDAERARLAEERRRLLSDVAALVRQLEDMRRSKSWRWSAPLRWVGSFLGRR